MSIFTCCVQYTYAVETEAWFTFPEVEFGDIFEKRKQSQNSIQYSIQIDGNRDFEW